MYLRVDRRIPEIWWVGIRETNQDPHYRVRNLQRAHYVEGKYEIQMSKNFQNVHELGSTTPSSIPSRAALGLSAEQVQYNRMSDYSLFRWDLLFEMADKENPYMELISSQRIARVLTQYQHQRYACRNRGDQMRKQQALNFSDPCVGNVWRATAFLSGNY